MSISKIHGGHPPMPECDHDECGQKCKRELASSAGSAHLTIGAQLQRAAELLKTDRLYKEDADHIQRLSEQANRMQIALLHLWQVSADPTKTGRYLTIQDREIIADALKDATAQNAELSDRRANNP